MGSGEGKMRMQDQKGGHALVPLTVNESGGNHSEVLKEHLEGGETVDLSAHTASALVNPTGSGKDGQKEMMVEKGQGSILSEVSFSGSCLLL